MKKSFQIKALAAACLSFSPLAAMAAGNSVVEFDRKEAESLGWRVVDDGVMGGLSKGTLQVSSEGILNFNGKLSLENNGGFSSLRTEKLKMDLSGAEGLVARVKGDGRTYQIRFGTDARFRGMEVSFMAEFATKKGEWTEVKIPFEDFTGSFRGMKLKKEVFNPAKISRIGLLLADKNPGSFEVQVDWIRTYGSESGSADIVATALSDGRFGVLAKALTEAELVGVLQGKGPFTVFAPTDKAFSALPKGTVETLLKPENRDQLQAVLKYHVLSGSVDLASALSVREAATVQGAKVNVAFEDGQVKVNDSTILNADITCSNGVIHVIDSVLLPPKPANDIANVAKRAGKFSTLLAAVDAAGLSDLLSSDASFTVFAPTDEAFKALPKGTVETLLKPENKEKLREILALHAVSGKISAGDALNAGQAKALGGGELGFAIDQGTFKVNGVTIVKTDIQCDNGVIHVIDAVLLPGRKSVSSAPSKSALNPIEEIESAISRGVPVFNEGNPGKCADIYRECMVMIANDCKVDPKVAKVLNEVVKRTEGIKSDRERAWVLRAGLDHIYTTLSN